MSGAELQTNGMTNITLLEQASPIAYVTKHSAPILIIHGEHDELVHPNQAQVFFDKLKAVGVPARLIMVLYRDARLATCRILIHHAMSWCKPSLISSADHVAAATKNGKRQRPGAVQLTLSRYSLPI